MPERISSAHESDNVSVRIIAWFGLGLLLLVVVAIGGVALVFRWCAADSTLVNAESAWQHQTIGPGVQPNQAADREKFQADEDALLSHYGWQDEKHNFAHIPIDRAMNLMSEQKLDLHWSTQNEVEP